MAKLELNNAFNHPIFINLSLVANVFFVFVIQPALHSPSALRMVQTTNNKSNTNLREKKCATKNIKIRYAWRKSRRYDMTVWFIYYK